MTEAEWLACEDPPALLQALRHDASPRKLRLFAVTCCKDIWANLTDERSRKAVELAERHADDALGRGELDGGRSGAQGAFQDAITPECYEAGEPQTTECAGAWAAALTLAPVAQEVAPRIAYLAANAVKLAPGADPDVSFLQACLQQCALIREVFGNPFRRVAFDPAWRTDTAVSLARRMYDARDFSAMPILADALQDAGCDNDDILAHCRGPGPHVRGCWVVDLVLGKE